MPDAADPSPLPRRSPGRPPQQATSALRELYLTAAFETFVDKGYAGAGIDEIARRARAGKMTFYRAFGSKDDLFRLVVRRALERLRDKLRPPAVDLGAAPQLVLPGLIAWMHAGFTDPDYLQLQRLLVAAADRFPELGEAWLTDDNWMVEPVHAYLSAAAARGELAIEDPYAASLQLAALASGGGRFLMKKPGQSAERRAQWVQAILRFAMAAWLPRGGHTQPATPIRSSRTVRRA